jgi:O-succinylbenzoic acid--CoA ligase
VKIDPWLARAAHAAPERPALAEGATVLSYRELEREAASAARRLHGMGARRGERVALLCEHTAGLVVLLHGLMKLGAVAAPLDPRSTVAEADASLDALRPALVIRDPEEVVEARESPEAPLVTAHDPGEVHCVIQTSGTTGRPAVVALTYGNHLASAAGSAARIGTTPADRWLCCMPLHHVGGLSIVLRCAIFGSTVAVERFEAGPVATTLAEDPVTLASLVPTMLGRLLDAGADLTRLRCALIGGGPASLPLVERALEAGAPIAPTYGMTEAASQVATLPPSEVRARPASVGPPLDGTQVRIDTDGRILVRGPTVAPGAAGPDGWLRTGDLGRLDEGGYLYVLGRADDVIVTGGDNVSPEEVEQVLLSHPGVAEAAVGGREDPEWQRSVVAWVVPSAGADPSPAELRAFCRERLAGHKVPKAFELVAELPRNSQGKLLRNKLARPSGRAGGSESPPRRPGDPGG